MKITIFNFDDLYRELEQFQKMASCLFNKGAVLGVDICGENPKADQNRNNVFIYKTAALSGS